MSPMSQATVPFKRLLFDRLSRLALSDRLSGYQETAGPYETAVQSRLGPLAFGASDCHVLDSRDAWLELRAGCLRLAFTVCIGRQPIRRTGLSWRHMRPARDRPAKARRPCVRSPAPVEAQAGRRRHPR